MIKKRHINKFQQCYSMWGRGGSKSGLVLSAVARETACSRKKETKENEEKGMRGSWRNRRIIWCGQHRAGRGKSKVHVVSGEVNQKNNEQVREVGERKVKKTKQCADKVNADVSVSGLGLGPRQGLDRRQNGPFWSSSINRVNLWKWQMLWIHNLLHVWIKICVGTTQTIESTRSKSLLQGSNKSWK